MTSHTARAMITTLATAAALALVGTSPTLAVEVTRAEDRGSTIMPDAMFTGVVTYSPFYRPNDYVNAGAGTVEFTPGARTRWHSHSDGQYFVVTSGIGWTQERGGAKVEVRPGDVVWTPPGIAHWHGATAANSMSHIAVTPFNAEGGVAWMEAVSDADYLD